MIKAWRQVCLFLVFGACFSNDIAVAQETKDYKKLVRSGFEHWQCAASGILTGNDKYTKTAQRSFLRGSFLLMEWLSDTSSGKVPNSSIEAVPKGIELMPFPGSPLQFRMGYIWAQVEIDAREKTMQASDSFFFRFDSTGSLQREKAETLFQEANCETLN
jgi:hypothetical protein